MFSTDLSTRSCYGRAVVTLRGELDLADAPAVAAALTAVAAREPRIIVDLAALEFIDSSGVAALAHGRWQAWQAGGDLVLAAPQQQVLLVLATIRLTDAFSVYTTLEQASRHATAPSPGARTGRAAPRRWVGHRSAPLLLLSAANSRRNRWIDRQSSYFTCLRW